ncbi:MAG: hypothetical protein ACLSBH_12005 [Coprobacillus cateniformis]
MRKIEIIEQIKNHHYHEWLGKEINEETTRDQILFGDIDEECTGIITAIYASVDVIKHAIEKMSTSLLFMSLCFGIMETIQIGYWEIKLIRLRKDDGR